jgi:hypothetical protein
MATNNFSLISIKTKSVAQIISGIFGGTVLGLTTFLAMMNFGANYGCWNFIDRVFGTAGYESCGSFGSIVGILSGVLFGVLIIRKLKNVEYSKVVLWLSIGSFFLPFLYGIITFFPQLKNGNALGTVLMISAPILAFIFVSALVSIFFTWMISWISPRMK